jgi:hypothetical protein
MSKTVNLSEDGSQFMEIKDLSELNSGDRRAVKAAVNVTIDPETGNQVYPGDMNDRMTNALAARVITNWNLQWPLPSRDITSLDKLTFAQYDAMSEGLEEFRKAINKAETTSPAMRGTDPTAGSAS